MRCFACGYVDGEAPGHHGHIDHSKQFVELTVYSKAFPGTGTHTAPLGPTETASVVAERDPVPAYACPVCGTLRVEMPAAADAAQPLRREG